MATRRFPDVLRQLNGHRKWAKLNRRAERAFSSTTPIEGLSYIHNLGEQPLKYKTIGQCLEESANEWPDRPWVVACEQQRSITFSQMLEKADRLAAGLLQIGLVAGDRVGLCAPNVAEWLVVAMAAARANLVLVTVNPAYQKLELEYCLNNVGVSCLVVQSRHKDHDFGATLMELAPELAECKKGELRAERLPELRTVAFIDDREMPGTFTLDQLASIANAEQVQRIGSLQKSFIPDDMCNIQFTSGTTGKPKGACLSHFNFVNNSFMIGKRNHLYEKHHKICVQVPLFHAFGIVIVAMASLQHGSTMILPSPYYSPKRAVESVQKERCTILTGTPTMYVDAINTKRSLNAELNSLEIGVVGGSPCSPQLIQDMKNELNISRVKSIYGMTETSASIFQSLSNEDLYKATETVGHVQEHVEVKVMDNQGNLVPFGVPGELWTRGYNTMIKYWNNEEKTREIYTPTKWLKTGDQFILQKDGYGKVVGRLKDVIIRGGENIYPKEIEDFLNTHPKILETQVFGVEDERLGEEICAGVRLKDGQSLSEREMSDFCKGNIASYKIPRYLRIVRAFPKTASGKIQKFKLREMFANGELANESEGSSYWHLPGRVPLEMITVGRALQRSAERWPDRPFIVSPEERLTFGELHSEADKVARGLKASGLKPGDRIGIYAPNSCKWFVTMMAAAKLGLITVAINPACTEKELAHCLAKAEIKCLALPSSYKGRNNCDVMNNLLSSGNDKIESLEMLIMFDDRNCINHLKGAVTYDYLKSLNSQTNISSVQPDDHFCILFTSGTTGLPKGAIQTHFAYLNNSRDIGKRLEIDKECCTICLQLPFFHAFGLLTVLAALQFGSTVVLPYEVYNVSQCVDAITRNDCTILTGTPTMYVDIQNFLTENNVKLDTLKIGVVGGAPCSPELYNRIKNYIGIDKIKAVFGMTEILGCFVSMPDESDEKAAESVGKVLENLEVKVVDKDGCVVAFGTPGELMVRGYANMPGYWGDKSKTDEMIDENGWVKTGDQFILEADGYGKICGRFKDIIIRGGENVTPKEIEDFIDTHPDVIETHIFGVKDDRMGEEICAAVRIREGSNFDYEKLASYCKGRIASYKIPKMLKVVDEFPKTTSGKIQKFKLKEMVESGRL